MKTCKDCGCAIYNLGCVNCNEVEYIEEQDWLTEVNAQENARHDNPEPTKAPL